MRRFLIALQFMTAIPIPCDFQATSEDMGKCMAYFPLVGLLLGGLLAALHHVLLPFFPGSTVDLVCILGLIGLTRGFHLDGLADTADAFLSHRDRERMLAIMKDSRIGTMGVLALMVVLALKFQLLMVLPATVKPVALLSVPMASRWGIVLQAAFLPYARSEGGLGKAFVEHVGWRETLVASVLAVGVHLVLWRMRGLLVLLCCGVFALLFAWYIRRRIGGCTGDTLGAGIELGEIVVFLSVYVLSR